MPKVRFLREKIEIEVPAGETILGAAKRAGAPEGDRCGGVCACSTCHVYVTKGFDKRLEIQGVGYRAALRGAALELNVGYSHPVVVQPPPGITFEVPAPTQIVVKGVDKQQVGQIAAEVRRVRPPEPYKGKGIRYEGEYVRRKVGKRA